MKIELDLGKVGITIAGEWNGSHRYEPLTVVTYNGTSYLSRTANNGIEPGTDGGDTWQPIAANGKDGRDGKDGKDGGGSGTIGVAYYTDGVLYWTIDGEWLIGPDGNKVQAEGRDGKDGRDGGGGSSDGAFKSIVFKRSNERPETPVDGTYEYPVPSGWNDGIPAGEAKLWMSSRWFYPDAERAARTVWSAPAQATDTATIDFEYSSIVSPGNPTTNPSFWHNDGRPEDIWMAMRVKFNGVWGEWAILKIKGEDGRDGRDGKDGTSIRILGSLDSSSELPLSGNEIGDAYVINGDLWVWDGDSWQNCGPFKGEDGLSQYIHVAYSNDGGITLTGNGGTDIGKYFGYYISTSSQRTQDASAYTWSKWQGEDGFGYEFIFKLTATSAAPSVPESSNVDDYVPTGWSDDPQDVSAEYAYCWMCMRKKQNGVWGEYRGSETNPGYASLFAKYGADGADGADGRNGRGISSVVEMYAAGSSDTVAPQSSWATTVPDLSAALPYLWNYEIINYTDGTRVSTPPAVIGAYRAGRGIASVVEYYLASMFREGITINTPGWTTAAQQPSAANPYLWNYEVINFTDGTSQTTEPTVIGIYGVGADGADSVMVFKANATRPNTPTGTTVPPNGWALTPPAEATSLPIWVSTAQVRDGAAVSEWTYPIRITAQDGKDGLSAPFMPFTGKWESGKTYWGTSERVDVVYDEADERYYMAVQDDSEPFFISTTAPHLDNRRWKAFEGEFSNMATGLMFAERAVIENGVIRELETAVAGKRVVIESNEVRMYDANNIQKLRISGANLSPKGTSSGITVPTQTIINNTTDRIELPTWQVDGSSAEKQIMVQEGGTVTLNGTTVRPTVILRGFYGEKSVLLSVTTGYLVDGTLRSSKTIRQTLSGTEGSSGMMYSSDIAVDGINVSPGAGSHTIQVFCRITLSGGDGLVSVEYNASHGGYTGGISYSEQVTEVGANGFRVMFGSDYLFEAAKTGSAASSIEFVMRAGSNAGIKVTSSGVYKLVNGSWQQANL